MFPDASLWYFGQSAKHLKYLVTLIYNQPLIYVIILILQMR